MIKNKKIIVGVIIVILLVGFIDLGITILSKKGIENKDTENIENNNQKDTKVVKDISSIDDVYNSDVTKNYEDIRKLSQDYTVEDAIQDNCFVIGAKVYNDYLYSEFMNNYKNGKSTFIRVVQTTTEGDLFIIDMLYDGKVIHLVKDDTRDEFSSVEDRTIKYQTYEKVGIWKNTLEYWVLYNGKLPTTEEYEDIPDNLFIIATIN